MFGVCFFFGKRVYLLKQHIFGFFNPFWQSFSLYKFSPFTFNRSTISNILHFCLFSFSLPLLAFFCAETGWMLTLQFLKSLQSSLVVSKLQTKGQIQPAAYFCTVKELRIAFTFLHGRKKNPKNNFVVCENHMKFKFQGL